MKKEAKKKSASSRRHAPLRLEMRIREVEAGEQDAAAPRSVPVESANPGWRLRALVLLTALAIAGTYVGFRVNRGWIPADDGTLAQSALRVFEGQLPHRDFAEIYTGGLSFIHAGAFRLFGVSLLSLRICVFLFFLAWIPAFYYVALRFTAPLAAGAVTLLAVAWGFPNYPAAMPSWYNLFFATFGAAALLRYLEVRTQRWLFVAGVCGGISILIKVIGAYYIAGALLFLAFLEQSEAEREGTGRARWAYRAFSAGAMLAFLSMLVYVLRQRLAAAEFYHFVVPSAAMVGLILLGEKKVGAGSGPRFAALLRLAIPFGCGVLSPIAIFLTPYALSGSVGAFLSGVKSSSIARAVGLALIHPAPVQYVVFVLPFMGLMALAMYWDKFQGRVVGAAVGLLAVVVVVLAPRSTAILSAVWFSAVMLTPVVVALGTAAVLALRKRGKTTKLDQQRVALLISLAATCSLVQYPFAAPIYLCYAIPLTLLALLAIITTTRKQPGTYVMSSLVGLYLVFGVLTLIPLHLAELTHVIGHLDELQLPRGGVQIEGAYFFEDLAHFLRQHAPNGLMYAGNDCPELYFLSGLKNVTRDDTGARPEEVLKALQSNDVKVVVINEAPFFPGAQMGPVVRTEVMRKFPESRLIGIFHVFWRQ